MHCTAVPEAGGLLLATKATPKLLGGSAFWQAVVFLARHDAEGSLGLILNRPTHDRVGRGPDGWPVPVLVSAAHPPASSMSGTMCPKQHAARAANCDQGCLAAALLAVQHCAI